jgi:hypothetical protein
MQTLAIPIAFLFLCCLFLWVIIGSQGRWWLKLILMIVAVVISYTAWLTLDSYFGSPKRAELKSFAGQTAFLFWVTINEPEGNKDSGSICMWLRPAHETSPKLYRFPYSRSLHETSQGFLEEILKNNGAPIQIAFTGESRQGEQAANGNRTNSGVQLPSGGARGKLAYQGEPRVYELPPVKLQEKLTN